MSHLPKKFNPPPKIIITPPEISQPSLPKISQPRKFLNPQNFSSPPKFLNPPRKFLNPPPRKFLNPPPPPKISQPPPPAKISQPPPPAKISQPPPPENFSTSSRKFLNPAPRKFLNPPPRKFFNPKNMLRGNPPAPPTSFFFLFLSISFPSLFKKNLKISGGGFEPPEPPPPLNTPLDSIVYIFYQLIN